MGVYTDYEGGPEDDYCIIVACEIDGSTTAPDGTVFRIIPAGRYARFIVKGELHTAVAAFWQELWTMDLPRTFQYDFEEYQNDDNKHAEIHMYISLES